MKVRNYNIGEAEHYPFVLLCSSRKIRSVLLLLRIEHILRLDPLALHILLHLCDQALKEILISAYQCYRVVRLAPSWITADLNALWLYPRGESC